MADQTLYEILGVHPTATKTEIRAAYMKLCKTHHPDKGGDHKRFCEINEAYEVLSDDEKREKYDNAMGGAHFGKFTELVVNQKHNDHIIDPLRNLGGRIGNVKDFIAGATEERKRTKAQLKAVKKEGGMPDVEVALGSVVGMLTGVLAEAEADRDKLQSLLDQWKKAKEVACKGDEINILPRGTRGLGGGLFADVYGSTTI